MAREQVVGMAVAIVDHGEITHVNAYGLRNRENALPLQTDTIMYGASVTKAAFAYMVMQLVDEGRLDLDRSIAEYLPRPLPELRRLHRSCRRRALASAHAAHPAHASQRLREHALSRTRSKTALSISRQASTTPIRTKASGFCRSCWSKASVSMSAPRCNAASSIASA
jgi:CubicO group peptidase (beta-lactamase class C family)